MIQAIKDAALAYVSSLTGPGALCEGLTAVTDSQVATQATGNSPLFQILFREESVPDNLQGIGSATHFGTQIVFSCQLKSTAPEPKASRDLFALWYRRDAATQNLRGLKIALHQLMATGLAVGLDQFQVGLSTFRPGQPHDSYTSVFDFDLAFQRMFNG